MSSNLPDGVAVEVHSKDDCPHCTWAKAWLTKHGIPYTEILHNDRDERRAFYRDVVGIDPNKGTVPQIYLVDTYTGSRTPLGGAEELEASGLA